MPEFDRQRAMQLWSQVEEISNLYEYWANGHGLRYNTFLLYYYLLEQGDITQSHFSNEAKLSRQTVNSMVKKLERESIIQLIDREDSKKEKQIVLTEKGKKLQMTSSRPCTKSKIKLDKFSRTKSFMSYQDY